MAVRRRRLRGATYRDAVEVVLDLIPPELRPIAKGISGMRNILVYGYADVRQDLLYEAMREELGSPEAVFDVL
ncbi:HepT-like ribonuclease domain-containing protein [Thermoproteus tenax]|uniref:HEPN domain containing protein n=1 Tax=Thermoproteus tenax (strain ATCC 35583 / DSM 2078 / JCM 9277 / NBRC 100435 / Kra 1) TaxID=768679 RepID=G4RLX3_THETK|nr:HepT-like ribonuclease domain-containing protein [Thermoproteus tenax]CCC82568.1 HEPN domain containing protein [Thermoproteus tenax Kra 1]